MKKRTMKESDNISHLPGHITDQILLFLPIKDAVRTSVLSRKWRYKWSSLPELVFDDQCTSARVPSLQLFLRENLVKIIDKVLLLHTGLIHKFKLSHKGFCATSDIDHWILHLSRVSIKVIVLHFMKGHKYKIPTSLFNCQDLIHLELINCSVKTPSKFEGFKNLKILILMHVELSPNRFEALFSCCPLLKRLLLVNIRGITRVNIKAHNLEDLYLGGAFPDVAFGDMDCLKSVTVNVYNDIAYRRGPSDANLSNLHKFFQNLPRTQSLTLKRYSLKYLAIENVLQTLPNALVHLKHLFTCTDFNSVEEILTIMCLIRSSPQLKQVDFQARTREQTAIGTATNSWEDHQSSCFQQARVASLIQSSCFQQVSVASLNDISGGQPELRFIKFLLSRLPGLQKMRIKPKSRSGDGKLLREELLRFPRASAQAELIFLDPVNP